MRMVAVRWWQRLVMQRTQRLCWHSSCGSAKLAAKRLLPPSDETLPLPLLRSELRGLLSHPLSFASAAPPPLSPPPLAPPPLAPAMLAVLPPPPQRL